MKGKLTCFNSDSLKIGAGATGPSGAYPGYNLTGVTAAEPPTLGITISGAACGWMYGGAAWK